MLRQAEAGEWFGGGHAGPGSRAGVGVCGAVITGGDGPGDPHCVSVCGAGRAGKGGWAGCGGVAGGGGAAGGGVRNTLASLRLWRMIRSAQDGKYLIVSCGGSGGHVTCKF